MIVERQGTCMAVNQSQRANQFSSNKNARTWSSLNHGERNLFCCIGNEYMVC